MKQKLKLTFLTLWGMLFLCGTPSIHAQTTSISGSSISIVGDGYDDRSSSGSLRVDLPSNIQPGDVSFLFLGQSDATNLAPPSGWSLIEKRGPADINQEARYRVYQSGQTKGLNFNSSKNAFVYVITLRGVSNSNPIRESLSAKDSQGGGGSGCSGNKTRGPARSLNSIATANNGVRFLSCVFDDPHIGRVYSRSDYSRTAMIIEKAERNGDDGILVAYESTDGSRTDDRWIRGINCEGGGNNDVVIDFTINPSGSGGGGGGGSDVIVDLCESTSGWTNSSANSLVLSGTRQQGSHSIKSIGQGTDDFRKSFSSTIDGSGTNQLELWYYVSSISHMNSSDQVELGSAGQADSQEYHWGISRGSLQTGWNKLELPYSSAGTTGGSPNLSALNWFRLYRSKNNTITSRIDDIRLTSGANKQSNGNYVTEHISNFKISPNPAQNIFKVYLNDIDDPVQVQVYDLQGRLVLEGATTDLVTEFDVSQLERGLYLVKLGNHAGSENVRLAVQ